MDKTAITKYLAKEMGWEVKGDFKKNTIPHYYHGDRLIMWESSFDPFNDIRHAFMVVEWMVETQGYAAFMTQQRGEYAECRFRHLRDLPGMPEYECACGTMSKAITLAAFKALAPAELQEKWL